MHTELCNLVRPTLFGIWNYIGNEVGTNKLYHSFLHWMQQFTNIPTLPANCYDSVFCLVMFLYVFLFSYSYFLLFSYPSSCMLLVIPVHTVTYLYFRHASVYVTPFGNL